MQFTIRHLLLMTLVTALLVTAATQPALTVIILVAFGLYSVQSLFY